MRRFIMTGLTAGLVLGLTALARGDEVKAVRDAIERIKKSADNRWEKIPWQPSLIEARKVSAKEKRPLFLFTMEGNVASGRC
jgi:hypothetical protein